MIYGEVGTAMSPSHTLILNSTVRENELLNNLTTEYIQTGLTNRNAMYQHIERASNVKNEE